MNTRRCYHPGGKFKGKHFSVPSQILSTGVDPRQFYGIAMFVNPSNSPHGGALIANGMSHAWIRHISTIPISDMDTRRTIQTIPIGQVDSGKALGGWHAYCVKEKPNR